MKRKIRIISDGVKREIRIHARLFVSGRGSMSIRSVFRDATDESFKF